MMVFKILAIVFIVLFIAVIIASLIIVFSTPNNCDRITRSKRSNLVLELITAAFIFFILFVCFTNLTTKIDKEDPSNVVMVKIIGMTFYNESNDELMVSFKTDNNLIVNYPVDSDKIICDIQTDTSYYKYNSITNIGNKIGLTLDTYKLFIDENNRNYITIN